MGNWITAAWTRLRGRKAVVPGEVVRIAALQEEAVRRRAEHAAELARAAEAGEAGSPGAVAVSRTRMKEAETAHMVAVQHWDNKQWRMRAR